jgi:hypothetical protein
VPRHPGADARRLFSPGSADRCGSFLRRHGAGALTLAQTGTLQLAVNAAELFVQPDKTVIFKTPATLVIQKGQGSSLISSRPRHGRMAVQPIGISPDSAERAAIVGTAVKLTRLGTESRVRLEVERP